MASLKARLDSSEVKIGKVPTKSTISRIIPDVLYPSSGNDLAGAVLVATTTGPNSSIVASSKYGTVQASDGRMYYYTDIKGSKTIKDPRIGAYFGSQRHTFGSLQRLEQETATHGESVHSVDGREWLRAVGSTTNLLYSNNPHGNRIGLYRSSSASAFLEITGYFNDANLKMYTGTNRTFKWYLDGGSISSALGTAGSTTPLNNRYVDASSVVNMGLGASLGIHTIKIVTDASDDLMIYGCELIAQDIFTDATCDYNNDPTIAHDANTRILAGMTVSGTGIPAGATVASVTSTTAFELSVATTTGSVTNGTLTFAAENIQIPSQNVVSFGKEFTVAGIPHYNPFAHNQLGTAVAIGNTTSHGKVATGWAGTGAGYFDSTLDTATSLGLSAWETGGDFYRPVNGGRIVKWVDSSGNIKTSVTMMPPSGTCIANQTEGNLGTDAGLPTSHAWTTVYQPKFSSTAPDHTLAEIAKVFHWREFGNGAANAGPAGGEWVDCSMLGAYAGNDNLGYVMDDGLTSLNGTSIRNQDNVVNVGNTGDNMYITFIGTGLTLVETDDAGGDDEYEWNIDGVEVKAGQTVGVQVETTHTVAQNLPYGTHVFKTDCIVADAWGMRFKEFTFHQPKMPPIPDDAVVLADYMLMADTVHIATSAGDYDGHISKGMLRKSVSRDFYYSPDSGSTAPTLSHSLALDSGFLLQNGSGAAMSIDLPHFGTKFTVHGENANTNDSPAWGTATYGGTSVASVPLIDNTAVGNAMDKFNGPTTAKELGVNKLELTVSNGYGTRIVDFNTPIHTSSHYQIFETPVGTELVGGDRNMEQTNLVVTPDGKTWDQVTRDTSYIGNMVLQASVGAVHSAIPVIFDDWRGRKAQSATYDHVICFCKDSFTIAYDRTVCLIDGSYSIHSSSVAIGGAAGTVASIYINGAVHTHGYNGTGSTGYPKNDNCVQVSLKRHDYVQIYGAVIGEPKSCYWIERI